MNAMSGLMGSQMQRLPIVEDLQQLPEISPTSSLSNTVCIMDPEGNWSSVEEKTVEQLSEFGEIARLDTSLVVSLRCVLVTYYDVRCSQQAMLHWADRTEPFPAAPHDCRIVRINMAAFVEKLGSLGGFHQFGEVANISVLYGDAIVEFYDMRAAQYLLSSAGRAASAWGVTIPTPPPQQPTKTPSAMAAAVARLTSQAQVHGMTPPGLPLAAPGLGSAFGKADMGSSSTSGANMMLPELLATLGGISLLEPRAKASAGATASATAAAGVDLLAAQQQADTAKVDESASGDPRASNRPVRTKVNTNDFSKYDIDPAKIQAGQDSRTTVMVRNLTGARARKDFLKFLDKCGLSERYTFFYMPCKEHRNIPAGFAFVNFVAPCDVHKLYVMVKSGLWSEINADVQAKCPAVSYGRFQGHDELVKHFSSSAVLHEQDPEKRPIFRPQAGKAVKEVDSSQDSGSIKRETLEALPQPAYISLAGFEPSGRLAGISAEVSDKSRLGVMSGLSSQVQGA